MFGFVKCLAKSTLATTAVLGAVAGGAVLIAGPARTKAVVHQAHNKVLSVIDSNIDDPVALRNELSRLEKEYPKRISAVRGDLAELNEQIRQLEQERAVSERVVELARLDLGELEPALQQAMAQAGEGRMRLTAISAGDHVYSLNSASTKVRQLKQIVLAHQNRAADAVHDLSYLNQQATRFGELLGQLETERAQFQTQLFQLERQVDSIQRNERLIHLLERRQRTLDECETWNVDSLDQIQGKLAQIRSAQEAELDVLTAERESVDYESMARIQLEAEQGTSGAVEEAPGYEVLPLVPSGR